MCKSCIVATSQVPPCQRGSLSPTSPSAIANVFAQWAFINFILFYSPFIIGTLLLKLFPCIINNVSSMNDLATVRPPCLSTAPCKRTSLLNFENLVCWSTNFLSSGSSLRRISTLAIQFSGGWAAGLLFPTCIGSHVMSCPSQVSFSFAYFLLTAHCSLQLLQWL